MTTAFSNKHDVDASDLILLVQSDFSCDEIIVVPENQFVKYLTTDTSKFYPVITPSLRSIDGDRFDGYAWFNFHMNHLLNESNSNKIAGYLSNVAKSMSGYCFSTKDDDADVMYSFVVAKLLNPELLKDLTIAHYDSPTPLSWLATPVVDDEADPADPAKIRPMWLL